jgi:hypothetical protein
MTGRQLYKYAETGNESDMPQYLTPADVNYLMTMGLLDPSTLSTNYQVDPATGFYSLVSPVPETTPRNGGGGSYGYGGGYYPYGYGGGGGRGGRGVGGGGYSPMGMLGGSGRLYDGQQMGPITWRIG